MYWYLISAMVLLAAPVYVIVARHQAIPHADPRITAVRVGLLVVFGGASGLFFALGLVPTMGFSYGLIFLVSLLSVGSVCSVLMKYEDLVRTTPCRIGLAIGLIVSLAVAPLSIPIYVKGRTDVVLDDNSSADSRKDIAEMLEKYGDSAVDPLVKAVLRLDPNSSADRRRNVLEALVQLGEAAIDPLIEALSDNKWKVRRSAAKTLGQLGNKRAVDPLIEALSDDNRYVRGSAARALGQLGDKRAFDPLIVALSDKHYDVRRSAAKVLGQMGDKRAINPLTRLLADQYPTVQGAAEAALQKLGYEYEE